MRRIRWDPEAQQEAVEAAEYYAEKRPDGGAHFREHLQEAISNLRSRPSLGSPFTHRTRRRLLRGYEYSVIYVSDADEIFILAVMHHRRKPGYWTYRLRHRT